MATPPIEKDTLPYPADITKAYSLITCAMKQGRSSIRMMMKVELREKIGQHFIARVNQYIVETIRNESYTECIVDVSW